MRICFLIAALGLACAHAEAGDEAVKMFGHRCATCHSIPDPAIRTDVAWLDQVNRTS